MLCKYYLQLGVTTVDITSTDCLDVSNMVKNLENLIVSFSRTDLGGVVRKCGSSIEFVNNAYDALVSHYKENYLKSSGVFAVYTIDNNWNYSKLWECPLDFATFQYTSYVATISCVDNSVAAVIKANKKTKYEFSASEIKDSSKIAYLGVKTRRDAEFYLIGTDAKDFQKSEWDFSSWTYTTGDMCYEGVKSNNGYDAGTSLLWWPQISFNKGSFQSTSVLLLEPSCGELIKKTSQAEIVANAISDGAAFIECLEDCEINLLISFFPYICYGQTFVLYCGSRLILSSDQYFIYNAPLKMYKGEKLFFGIYYQCANDNTVVQNRGVWSQNTQAVFTLESEYMGNNKFLENIRPISLLQKILDKMFEQTGISVTGTIESTNDILNHTRLVAAETIRNLSDAKVYTSFSDFCDFMETVYGFTYTITETDTGGKVTFKHRRNFFPNSTIKQLSSANNLQYTLDESKIYSRVEIGYPKKDYQNDNNAKYEYNFSNTYVSGITLNEESLSLLCKYRADCYGVEELMIKSKTSEKTDSDEDLFIIVINEGINQDGYYTIDRSTEVKNAYTDTVFNAKLAPNQIIQHNKEYFATFTNKLSFASSDANSSAVIGGTAMSADISITGQMFKAGKISIDTDDMVLPESWDGVVKFELNKKTYQGYLESIDINFAKSGTITYNLIEKCIE